MLWVYPRNLPSHFGQNQVNFRWNVVVVVLHVIVVFDPTNLPLKFGLNQVRNSKDIYDIEFVGVVVVVSGDGGLKSFLCHTQLLSWVVVEL